MGALRHVLLHLFVLLANLRPFHRRRRPLWWWVNKSVSSQWFGGTMVALWHGLSENWKSCHLVGWCIISNPTFERVCVAFALKTCYPESLVFSPCNVFMVMVIFTVIIIKIAMTIIILIFIFIIGTWFCSTCLNVIFWQPKKDHLGHLEDMGIALL